MSTITPAELANALNTTAKNTRKFLRDNARENGIEIPGKGSRWAIEKREVRSLKAKYAKWNAAQESARAERAAKRAEFANDAVENAPENDGECTIDCNIICEHDENVSFDDLENPLDA